MTENPDKDSAATATAIVAALGLLQIHICGELSDLYDMMRQIRDTLQEQLHLECDS